MEQKNQNRLSMWKAVQHHLEVNSAVWRSVPAFQRAYTALQEAIAAAGSALNEQTGPVTGVTDEKHALETRAVDCVLRIARSAKAYALEGGDAPLLAAVDYPRNTLNRLPQNELVETLHRIVTAASAKSRALVEYGIARTEYDAALAAVQAYGHSLSAPRQAIAGRKAVTDAVPVLMKTGAAVLARLDNLIHLFEEDHPRFVAAYKTNRVLVDAGHRREHGAPPEAGA